MGDSLDLGRLADNLPSNNGRGARAMQAAEADLQSAFRNSALCITQMLKAGQKASKRSYQAGYSTALQDVLEYLQASLDVNVAQQRSNEGVAQVIDYIEARQEAVRLELQDLEAEEDQQQQGHQQHAASPRTQPASNYQHPSSSQSFRSHPHLRQYQEQQQHSTTSYRQSQPSYQPVASTSGTTGHSSSSLQHRKPRSAARSLSPLNNNASMQESMTNRPASAASASHHRVHDLNDAERTQESIPLASSSSIPNSPVARFSPELTLPGPIRAVAGEALPTAGATPPHSSTTLDASLSNTSTAVSPLTRLQAKRERERYHDRRSRIHGSGDASQGSSAAIAAGVKRRWTAALLPEHHTINLSMNLGNATENMDDGNASEVGDGDEDEEDTDTSGQDGQQQQTGQRKFNHVNPSVHEDDTGMEMDDNSYRIDGNARPMKRTTRR